MPIARLADIDLHYLDEGPHGAPAVVFANSLGTDLRIWDAVCAALPEGLRRVRYDMRGHGLSGCPPGPYKMGTLVRDAEQLIDRLELRDCVFIGLSIGGMVAQGLAVKRLDLIRAMVLSNTAAKIGTPQMWHDRITAIRDAGIAAMADQILERWFTPSFRQTPDFTLWRNMLIRQPVEGYCGCAAAIAGTDFMTPTSGLRLPTLAIAGSEDGATPPDLVFETAGLVPGAQTRLMRGVGHLPCVEDPRTYADHLTAFLRATGHL